MEGLNKVILCGALGADPELKFTQGGKAHLRLRVATTESWWDKEAQSRKERTEWHTVSLWGKRAESLSKLLSKGSKVWIEGRLQTRSWDDKDGQKRYATDVEAAEVGLMGGGQRDDGQRQGYGGPRGGGRDEASAGPGASSQDDIPFAPVGDVG
jgi:single-strand DNA-binding protein